MLNIYIDGKYSHLMSLLAETAIMSVYEISSLFSNFLLIACDSVILDSLKHVFYIVLHMNLTLSFSLSHSFFLSVFFISFSLCFESPSLSSISPFLDYYNMTVYLRLRNPTEISLLTSTRTYRKGWNDDVCAF